MGLLFLLSGLLFGGDVHRLGHLDFGVRHTANERLKSAGWLAYPAVLRGLDSPVAEKARRCEELLDGLDAGLSLLAEVEAVARGVVPLPEAVSDEYMAAVCRRVDRLGGWKSKDSWVWVRSTPYQCGTRRADCEFAIRSAAARRAMEHLFPPLVPGLTTK